MTEYLVNLNTFIIYYNFRGKPTMRPLCGCRTVASASVAISSSGPRQTLETRRKCSATRRSGRWTRARSPPSVLASSSQVTDLQSLVSFVFVYFSICCCFTGACIIRKYFWKWRCYIRVLVPPVIASLEPRPQERHFIKHLERDELLLYFNLFIILLCFSKFSIIHNTKWL